MINRKDKSNPAAIRIKETDVPRLTEFFKTLKSKETNVNNETKNTTISDSGGNLGFHRNDEQGRDWNMEL